METDKIISKQQITDITMLCELIFHCTHNSFAISENNLCFDVRYAYKDYDITIAKDYETRYGYYCFDIYVVYRKEPFAESTTFWQLYAYYDDQRCDLRADKLDNATIERYLVKLKEYLDNNRFFYGMTDIANRKRYFVIEGQRKELPYIINLETEDELRFGEEGGRISCLHPKF